MDLAGEWDLGLRLVLAGEWDLGLRLVLAGEWDMVLDLRLGLDVFFILYNRGFKSCFGTICQLKQNSVYFLMKMRYNHKPKVVDYQIRSNINDNT